MPAVPTRELAYVLRPQLGDKQGEGYNCVLPFLLREEVILPSIYN